MHTATANQSCVVKLTNLMLKAQAVALMSFNGNFSSTCCYTVRGANEFEGTDKVLVFSSIPLMRALELTMATVLTPVCNCDYSPAIDPVHVLKHNAMSLSGKQKTSLSVALQIA